VATRALAAVDGTGVQAGVALAADHLVAVVLGCQDAQGRLDDASSQAKHQVKSGFLLDVVVGKGAAIFELLSGEDQSLLVRRDSFLVLDLSLDIFDSV